MASPSAERGRPNEQHRGPFQRLKMKFLNHFRSKSNLKKKEDKYNNHIAVQRPTWRPTGEDYTLRLDTKIIRRILGFVCPHSRDESFESCENSMVGDGCPLCDLRDLSNCCMVKRSWYGPASGLLYHSVRIDAVHYCPLEEFLMERRMDKSFRGRNPEPPDIPQMRLQLLNRTLKSNKYLAEAVMLLKVPYMTREVCKAELARAVSVCPGLRYVDLPEGCYNGEGGSGTLLNEVMMRCPNIRKMRYNAGAEAVIEQHFHGVWNSLEVLEISRLRMEPATFRKLLGALPNLHVLEVEECSWFSDQIFQSSQGPGQSLPEFPALTKLALKDIPNVTTQGLVYHLQDPIVRDNLVALTLTNTGIDLPSLHELLWAASHLRELSITATVTQSLPMGSQPLTPLSSITLTTLTYEILSSSDNHTSLHPPAASYHSYLITSLQNSCLPALRTLYVCDPTFLETLTLAPPIPAFTSGSSKNTNPFRQMRQPLEVYTKAPDEIEWVFSSYTPTEIASGRRGSLAGRPMSTYSTHGGLSGPTWGAEARKSIVVPNGEGGFLALPPPPEDLHSIRPGSSGGLSINGGFGAGPAGGFGVGNLEKPRGSWFRGHEKRGSRADLWR